MPLGLGGFSVVLVVAAVVLAVCALHGGRRRIRLWEGVALAGLVLGTIDVARNGTWLLFVLAYPAARGLHLRGLPKRLLLGIAVVSGIVALALLVRGPADPGSVPLARLAAHDGRPVLAQAVLGQQVALLHGKVWVDNPIDAFRRPDQRLYLDWAAGRPSGAMAVSHAVFVLVKPGSKAAEVAAADPRLTLVDRRPKRRPLSSAAREMRRAPAGAPFSAVGLGSSGSGSVVVRPARDRSWSCPRPWSSSFGAFSGFGGPLSSPAVRVRRVRSAARAAGDDRSVRGAPAPIVACVPDELKPPVAENVALKLPRKCTPPPSPPKRKPWTLPFTFTAPSAAWKWPGDGGVVVPAICEVAGERARVRRRVVDALHLGSRRGPRACVSVLVAVPVNVASVIVIASLFVAVQVCVWLRTSVFA